MPAQAGIQYNIAVPYGDFLDPGLPPKGTSFGARRGDGYF